MAFKINADKYAYSASPEKVSDNYASELAKKLISEEAKKRQEGDAALDNRIDIAAAEERGLRSEADRVLDERISLEASQRISGDELFQKELKDEASARQALERNLSGMVAAETQTREEADSQLMSEINDIKVLTEENKAFINNKADKNHTHTADDITISAPYGEKTSLSERINGHMQGEIEALQSQKAEKIVTVTELDYGTAERFEKTDTVANILNDLAYRVSFNEQLVGQDLYPNIYHLQSNKADVSYVDDMEDYVREYVDETKADKINISSSNLSEYTFDISDNHNKEIRLTTPSAISIKFVDTEYAYDYISGLSFNSGDTPTRFDYTASGIINWVGTDCTKDGDLSIFQPSENTHYDIVFYFNSSQFIGLVNGFVPASGNVVSV